MAIRDFGNSLLANVRERADEQRDDARRYARKQDKSNLLKGLGAMAGGALIKSAGAAITSSLEKKTQDFLASSSLADYQISVTGAEKKILEAKTVEAAAKKKNLSIKDYEINQAALAKATQAAITNPNRITENTIEDYTSAFRTNKQVMESGTAKAQYYTDILAAAPQLLSGKAEQTLLDFRAKQLPPTLVGAAWNKLTRNTEDVDVFNSKMDRMDQVIAAKKINALQFEEMAATASEAVKNGASHDMGRWIAGVLLSNEELKNIDNSIKRGDKVTETIDNVAAGKNIVQFKITETEDKDGNKSSVTTKEEVYKYGEKLTVEQAISLTGGIEDIRKNMADTLDGKGYGNFTLAVQKIITDPKKVTQEQYFEILALSLRPKDFLTGPQGTGAVLRPQEAQVRAAREKAFIESSANLISALSSLNTEESDEEKLEEARIYALIGKRRAAIYNITDEDILSFTSTGQINFTASQIDQVMKANLGKSKAWAQAFLQDKYGI